MLKKSSNWHATRTPSKDIIFNMSVVHEDENEKVVNQTDLPMAKRY